MLDSDKLALLNGTATIQTIIEVIPLDETEEVVELTEVNSVIDWDYEDFRYVDKEGVIGQFVARQLTGNLKNVTDTFNIENREINLKLGIKTDTTNWYTLGRFLITKPEDDEVKDITTFEALDYAKKFNKVFESNVTYPISAIEFARSICEQCGVELGSTSFRNDDFMIIDNQYTNNESCRDVMKDIGKLAYSWVRIGWDNKVYLDFNVKATDTVDTYDIITNHEYYTLKTQKNDYGPLNRVTIGYSSIEGERTYTQDTASIDENGLTNLNVYDNNLTYTQQLREATIEPAQEIFGFQYQPMEVYTVGHPWLLGNELIKVVDMEGNEHFTYAFNRRIEYNGHIKTMLISEASTQTEESLAYESGLYNSVKNTQIIVDKQNQTITQVVEDVGQYDERITTVETSLEEISQTIEQEFDLTREVSGKYSLLMEKAIVGPILDLRISGAMDLIYPSKPTDVAYDLLPSNDLLPRDDLYPSEDTEYQEGTFPSSLNYPRSTYIEFKTNSESVKYKLPINYLREHNGVTDEFTYQSGECKIIRRIGKTLEGDLYVLPTEIIEDRGLLEINNIKGDVTVTFGSFKDVDLYLKYAVESTLTDTFATKVELDTSITQTSNSIMLEVNKKVDDTEVVNALNVSTEGINIVGNRLTIDSDNFKLDNLGNVTLSDGARVISGDGLMTNLQYGTMGVWGGFEVLGFDLVTISYNNYNVKKNAVILNFYIPENFIVTNAYVTIITTGFKGSGFGLDGAEIHSSLKEIGLYKTSGDKSSSLIYGYDTSPTTNYDDLGGTEIYNAFGSSGGYTPVKSGDAEVDIKTSIDIGNEIVTGANTLYLQTKKNIANDPNQGLANSGRAKMQLSVLGFMSFGESE